MIYRTSFIVLMHYGSKIARDNNHTYFQMKHKLHHMLDLQSFLNHDKLMLPKYCQ